MSYINNFMNLSLSHFLHLHVRLKIFQLRSYHFAISEKEGIVLLSSERIRLFSTNTGNYAPRRKFRRTILGDVSDILRLIHEIETTTTNEMSSYTIDESHSFPLDLPCCKRSYELVAAD